MEISEIETMFKSMSDEIRQLKNQSAMMEKRLTSGTENEILSTSQMAKYMGVHRSKIDLWRKYGLLPAIQTGTDRWSFRKSDADKLWNDWNGFDISNEDAVKFSLIQREHEKKMATKCATR